MSFMDSLKRAAGLVGRQVMGDVRRNVNKELGRRTRQGLRSRATHATDPRRPDSSRLQAKRNDPQRAKSAKSKGNATRGASTAYGAWPGASERAIEYDIERYGLPNFEYEPERNGAPDPGEVVWTWVPFDENDGRGKDRPVLVLADTEDHVIFGQMTSKDNTRDAEWEAKWGRHWIDVGTGEWDSKGRPSEVRLDRLLVAHMDQIRREGSFLRKDIYDDVVRALEELHGSGM